LTLQVCNNLHAFDKIEVDSKSNAADHRHTQNGTFRSSSVQMALRQRSAAPSDVKNSPDAVAKPAAEKAVPAVGVFDFASHAKGLVTPPARPGGFEALDGFRELCCHSCFVCKTVLNIRSCPGAFLSVWIIAFHTSAYAVNYFSDHDIRETSRSNILLAPLMIGPLAVDVSFGFIALFLRGQLNCACQYRASSC
jgi:hypothetical protein